MKYKYNKLRGKIKEMLGTEEEYAKMLGITKTGLSYKLNNKNPFSQNEIFITIKKFNIPNNEIGDYFFTEEVEKNETSNQ